MSREEDIRILTNLVARNFRSFGGGEGTRLENNPVAHALKDKPPVFAAGVDISEVVAFVLSSNELLQKQKEQPPSQP